jgi:hypothetical protein
MICVVVLQDGMDVVEGATGSYSETGVTCDVEETVEVNIKVEDAIYLNDEIPEAVTSPPINTEQAVRLWGVYEVVAAHAFEAIYGPKKETVKLHLTVSCFVLYCGCHILFEIWIAI